MTMLADDRARPAWWRTTRSLLGLAAVVVGVLTSPPDHRWSGVPLVLVVVCLPIGVGGWLVWLFGAPTSRLATVSIIVSALAGLVLAVIQPNGVALVFPAVACAVAGANRPASWSVPFAATLGSAFVIARAAERG